MSSHGSAGQTVASICAECGADVHFAPGQSQVRCDHCDGGLAVDDDFLVRLACPVCSGNFYYLDGSMSGRCPFCDTPLLALTRDQVFRFVIRPAAAAPNRHAVLHFLPFWRLAALSYNWNMGSEREIKTERTVNPDGSATTSVVRKDTGPRRSFSGRVVDQTVPDPATQAFGVTSLRLRAKVFPLEPFTAAHESLGKVIHPLMDADPARTQLYDRVMALRNTNRKQRLISQRTDLAAESLALLYYPFWIQHTADDSEIADIWDAVSGEGEKLTFLDLGDPGTPARTVFDQLRLIELRCQHCGQQLPQGNHSVVFPCRGCGRFWVSERDGLAEFHAHFAAPELDESEIAWLPFWRLEVAVRYRRREAETVGQLRRCLGVMRPPGQGVTAEDDSPLHYYVPAYGAMRAPRLDPAARDMTRVQPRLEPVDGASGGELYHCFYGPEDARRLAYMVWIQILPGTASAQVRSLRVRGGEVALWYLPFADLDTELVNLLSGARYARAAFRGLRH